MLAILEVIVLPTIQRTNRLHDMLHCGGDMMPRSNAYCYGESVGNGLLHSQGRIIVSNCCYRSTGIECTANGYFSTSLACVS